MLPRPVTVTATTPPSGWAIPSRRPGTAPTASCRDTVAEPSCSTASGTGVGDRPTTCSGPAEDLHYRYTYAPGVLSVTRAPITVVATSPSATFGQPCRWWPAPTWVSSPASHPRPPPARPSRARSLHPARYPTTCEGPAADDNYDYHYVAGTLTVTRAPVRVSASSPTVVVGQPVPVITASTTGTVSGTPPAATTCSTVTPKGAGTSPTACSGPSSDASYTYTLRRRSAHRAAGRDHHDPEHQRRHRSGRADRDPAGGGDRGRPGPGPVHRGGGVLRRLVARRRGHVVNGQATLSLPSWASVRTRSPRPTATGATCRAAPATWCRSPW